MKSFDHLMYTTTKSDDYETFYSSHYQKFLFKFKIRASCPLSLFIGPRVHDTITK